MRLVIAAVLLATAAAAEAAPLTVRMGESWLFRVERGEPTAARKVPATAKPRTGELMVTVRALFGTTMIITNNSPVAYAFRAELMRSGKAVAARSCNLPANGRPLFEQWQQTADAVRIGNFRASSDSRC